MKRIIFTNPAEDKYKITSLKLRENYTHYCKSFGVLLALAVLFLIPSHIWSKENKQTDIYNTTNSEYATPKLVGDTNLCILFGGVISTYRGGGDPGDVYEWKIFNSTGEILFDRSGGEQFETIQFLFTDVGDYVVSLKIRRGTDIILAGETLAVKVQKGPKLDLKPDYLFCGNDPVLLTALNPSTPNLSDYTIIWKSLDKNGKEVKVGTGNEYLTYSAGYHFAELFLTNPDGQQACSIRGTTFVGPPIDFKITQSADKICEGSNITVGTDTPLNGEWLVKKNSETTKTSFGNAFEITLSSTDLTGPGLYEVYFRADDAKYPGCPSERWIVFELLESPAVDIQILVAPDDCVNANGSFQIISSSDLDFLKIPELNLLESFISAGQVSTFTNLKPGIYTIISFFNGCESTKLVTLDAKNPPVTSTAPDQNKPTILVFPETCGADGVIKGKVTVEFGKTIGEGKYRLLSVSKGLIRTGAIPADGFLELDILSGSFLLELIIDGCTYPVEKFTIADKPEVEFTVPDSFSICETFEFTPQTNENLLFTLTYEDGSTQSLESGNSFTITQGGTYSLLAVSSDMTSSLCAKVKEFSVNVLNQVTFQPLKVVRGCFDPVLFTADIQGLLPEEASIRWINSNGEIVGRSLELYPPTSGIFSLLVQPLASGFCDVFPVEFEVLDPIISVPMDLTATKICPDPGTSIVTLTTDEKEVVSLEWIFYDLTNQREELTGFKNLPEIIANQPGTYEVVAFNKYFCEIGRNFILVEESGFLTTPNLDDSYPICSKDNILSPIDPGEYASYGWYFENQLVSTDRLFKPQGLGTYYLIVATEDGCQFEDTFTTFKVCNYEVVYPDAMILGNPKKDFRVLVSTGVTEAEIFVLNRQGALIHHAYSRDIKSGIPILNWDGKSQGKFVPIGTYVVVLILRNPLYGLEEKQVLSLLILD